MATTAELDALFACYQAAAKEEQRAYDELCDAEDDFERHLDAIHDIAMKQAAHEWHLACEQHSIKRRAYNQAMDPEGWERIRTCADLIAKNNPPDGSAGCGPGTGSISGHQN